MTFAQFLTQAETTLQPSLTSAGFRLVAAGNWNRRSGEDLNVISLQKHSSGSSFCVNLGIHYAFLLTPALELPIGDQAVESTDCEIKLRLTAHDTAKDQWWPLNRESINEVVKLISNRGLAIFHLYRLAGPISQLQPKEIIEGNHGLLLSLTKVRTCLLLARIHEHLGNREKCIESAKAGVLCAGMAVGPKIELKDILKRNDR